MALCVHEADEFIANALKHGMTAAEANAALHVRKEAKKKKPADAIDKETKADEARQQQEKANVDVGCLL